MYPIWERLCTVERKLEESLFETKMYPKCIQGGSEAIIICVSWVLLPNQL